MLAHYTENDQSMLEKTDLRWRRHPQRKKA
jgi:hypothetical protein